jgi:hypothetical protein
MLMVVLGVLALTFWAGLYVGPILLVVGAQIKAISKYFIS